tara:strand:- start:1787 stop:2005 length:219 start_codon:yes stop_codon:yes gene_type:complete
MLELTKKYLVAIDLVLLLLIKPLNWGFIAQTYGFIALNRYNWIIDPNEYFHNYDTNNAVYFKVAFNKYLKSY